MWWKLKFGASVVIVIATLLWTIIDLVHGQWWQAAATLSGGVIVTYGVLRIGEGDASWAYGVATIVFAAGGMGHFFFESPFTHGHRQQALLSLGNAFMALSIENGLPQAEQNEVMVGLKSCVMQPTTDAMATTTDAMKLAYETPRMSMVDRATGAGNPPPSTEDCINAYRQLRPQITWAFQKAEKESPWLLTQLETR